jgi:hypothetical protein
MPGFHIAKPENHNRNDCHQKRCLFITFDLPKTHYLKEKERLLNAAHSFGKKPSVNSTILKNFHSQEQAMELPTLVEPSGIERIY